VSGAATEVALSKKKESIFFATFISISRAAHKARQSGTFVCVPLAAFVFVTRAAN